MPQRVLILGSSGSIGTSTLDVIRDYSDRFRVVGLSVRANVDLLADQVAEFGPAAVCVADADAAVQARGRMGDAEILEGESGLTELVRRVDADVLVVATVGFAGLFPTLAGIERGMRIALANKEVLVVGGEMVMERARSAGVDILPIDSEHNAVFQSLAGNRREDIRRIVLTASGGPFRNHDVGALEAVTVAQALDHPTWDMGAKITIDSATLMNKGFEVIEACHLFGVGPERVDVVIHPQSVVHSMVEYADGSVIAQMGQTDMYLPILNVLAYPDRLPNKFEPLDLASLGSLTFEHPRRSDFPCLDYAFEAIGRGGTVPAALNGANEIAVREFLEGRIGFGDVPRAIRHVLDRWDDIGEGDARNPDNLKRADTKAREMTEEYARNIARS